MDGYLDFLFVGTILTCMGGNIAHFGSRRLLQMATGRSIWNIAAIVLLVSPVVLLVRARTWEVIAASIIGAFLGAVISRMLRFSRFDFYISLVSILMGAVLLVWASFMDLSY